MTSFQLSQRFDIHSVLFYGLALPLYRATVAIENAWRFIGAVWPSLLFWLGIVAKVLGLVAIVAGLVAVVAIVAGLVAVVAMIPVQFWLCLAGLVVGAWATYPRSKAAR